jgi:ubiquinone/menaquinone biosynthesis C-methylase UbiE
MPTTAEQAAERRAQADRKAAIAHGFDLVADVYGQVGDTFFTDLGAQLVARAGLRPGDRVLDLGCGRGAVLFAAARSIGPDGYAAGIDLSPEMVHATSADAARRGLRNVAVRVGDAEDPGFPAHSFEAVLAGLMMFITPDPDAALHAAHRVLVPGGRFAMTTFGPPEPGWEAAAQAALAFRADEPRPQPGRDSGGKARLGTLDAIAARLDKAGFTEIGTVEEEQVASVASPEQWWASMWASGRRAVLEQIPVERREQAREAAFAVVESLRVDGILTRRSTIRFTTAVA